LVKKVVEKQVNMQSNNNMRKMTQTKDEVLYNTANAKILAKPKKRGDYVDYEEID
jgi:hypothetical protein